MADAQVPQRANSTLAFVDVLVTGVNLLAGPSDAVLLAGSGGGSGISPGAIAGALSIVQGLPGVDMSKVPGGSFAATC